MKTLDVFLDPFDLFDRLDKRPNWLVPFALAVLLGILSALLISPVFRELFLKQIPEGLSGETREQMLTSMEFSKYYGILATPVVILVKWSVLSFVLFSISIIYGADLSYRKTLSVLGHASLIIALDNLLTAAVIYLRGVEAIRSPEDIPSTVLSLSNFLSTSGHPILRTLYDNTGVMMLWYFAVLALGLAGTARLSKRKSVAVVFILWLLQTGFLAGTTLIFTRYQSAAI